MRFLLPFGGLVDHRFGILTAPHHRGVPVGIREGMDWAADLGVVAGPSFIKRFRPDVAFKWLEEMREYRSTCLFVQVPDAAGDATATLEAWSEWASAIADLGWPLAFVAQDGQEQLPFPHSPEWTTLFVGGYSPDKSEWKVSESARQVILRAQRMGKAIHIGRVNWGRRYQFFRGLPGSEFFTCDGTARRWMGRERAVEMWAGYMDAAFTMRLPFAG